MTSDKLSHERPVTLLTIRHLQLARHLEPMPAAETPIHVNPDVPAKLPRLRIEPSRVVRDCVRTRREAISLLGYVYFVDHVTISPSGASIAPCRASQAF